MLGHRLAGTLEVIERPLDRGGVVSRLRLVDPSDGTADRRRVGLGQPVLARLERLLELVDVLLGSVARLGQLAPLLVLGGVALGVALHPLDLLLGQAPGSFDPDRLLLARSLILGSGLKDAVGVDLETDFDLRYAHRGRRDALQVELAEQPVVGRHGPLPLVDLDRHGGLSILGRW